MTNTSKFQFVTVLHQVVQEPLTNVTRHAHARSATVCIQKIRDGMRLEVHDNGRSFQVDRILSDNRTKRFGLLGMRERVERVGGTLPIDSTRGKGTTMRAETPFHRNRRGNCI